MRNCAQQIHAHNQRTPRETKFNCYAKIEQTTPGEMTQSLAIRHLLTHKHAHAHTLTNTHLSARACMWQCLCAQLDQHQYVTASSSGSHMGIVCMQCVIGKKVAGTWLSAAAPIDLSAAHSNNGWQPQPNTHKMQRNRGKKTAQH